MDITRLETALVNADAAGDTEAATALAGEIRRLRGTEGGAVSDVVPEIKNAFNENLAAFKQGFGMEGPSPGEKGIIQGTLDVGKGLAAIPGMLASPITGAARSLLGHPLASAINTAGRFINPDVANREDPRELYEAAKGGVDTAMMGLQPKGVSAKGVAPTVPQAAELKAAARAVYNDPATKAIQIPPNDVVSLTGGIQNDLVQRGFRPTPGSAPGTFSELERMTPSPKVSAVGVDDLRAARSAFDKAAKQVGPDFRPTTDAAAAQSAIRKIDDFLDTVSPQIRDANANYAAGRRAETLDFRTMKADRNAAKSGSGSNMENTMRQAVDKIGDRGLSPGEIAAKDRIVLGSPGRNALRKLGKLGVGDGLSLMLHAAAAPATGGMSVPVAAAGTAARKIGEILTRREIAALNKSIRTRSPLAKALASQPQFAKIPKGAKAIAAALLSKGPQNPVFAGVMPAYADEKKR